MLDSRISVAPGALRNAFANVAVGAIRAVQPVVGRAAQERVAERAGPASVQAEAPGTTYTPATQRPDTAPLYSRAGTPARSSGVFASASYQRSDSFDLQVQTAEGDVAVLRFASQNRVALAGSAVTVTGAATANAVQALALDTADMSNLQVRVKGNLNDEERAAIDTLAQQISGVADDFFAGDMDSALQGARRIDISSQTQTLSAYAFSLQSQETRTAAAMYESVAQATAPLDVRPAQNMPTAQASAPPQGPPAPRSSGDSKDLLKSLLALFEGLVGNLQAPLVGGNAANSNAAITTPESGDALVGTQPG